MKEVSDSYPTYIVSRCRKHDNVLYGAIHWSIDCACTLCGQEIDDKWWILSNGQITSWAKVTCKKCLRSLV